MELKSLPPISPKLLKRNKPKIDESLLGYIVRLTELNGYDTPSWILSLCGTDYMQLQWKFSFIFSRSKLLERLAQITVNTLSNLLPLLYLPERTAKRSGSNPNEYNFYGALLNRSVIRPHCPKICPKCLLEFGYCFRIWDCSLVTACPTHKCVLIDTCPQCRKRISCVRNRLSVCACEYDWLKIDSEIIPENELALSSQVYYLCGLLPPTTSTERANKNPLHKLNLRDLAVVTTFIAGLYGSISWAVGVPTKSIELANKDLHKLYTRATLIFEDWPHNFHGFLEEQSTGEYKYGTYYGKLETALKREFRSFYKGLYKKIPNDQYGFMKDSFAEFLTKRWKSGSTQSLGRSLTFSSSDKSSEYISINAARQLLKINHHSIFDLIKAREIEGVIQNNGTTLRHMVRRADVEKVKSTFEQSMSLRDITKELAIGRCVVKDLARAGYLQTKQRRKGDGYHAVKFDRDSVERLLSRVSNWVTKAHEPSVYGLLGFADACSLCESRGITVTSFIRAMVAGEIRPCADISNPGFLRFLFTKEVLFEYAERVIAKSHSDKNQCTIISQR